MEKNGHGNLIVTGNIRYDLYIEDFNKTVLLADIKSKTDLM